MRWWRRGRSRLGRISRLRDGHIIDKIGKIAYIIVSGVSR